MMINSTSIKLRQSMILEWSGIEFWESGNILFEIIFTLIKDTIDPSPSTFSLNMVCEVKC